MIPRICTRKTEAQILHRENDELRRYIDDLEATIIRLSVGRPTYRDRELIRVLINERVNE